MALAGVAVGAGLALGIAGSWRALFYGVTPHDPSTYAIVGGTMVLVALLATLAPAHRATTIAPATTLRLG